MEMKKVTRITAALTALGMAVSMASCGKKNGEVKLKDAKKELENYSFSQHDNLTFDCVPEPIAADEIYIITAKPKNGIAANESTKTELKKYVDLIFGSDIDINELQYAFTWTYEELENGEPDSSIDHFYFCVDATGEPTGQLFESNHTFSAIDYREYGPSWPTYKEMYFPNALPTEAFDMFDGSKLTIEEAKSEAEGYIKLIEPLFNEGSSYQFKRAVSADHAEKGAELALRYEHMFYGLPVCDDGFDSPRDNEQYVFAPYLEVRLLGKGYPCVVNNSHYDLIDTKEKVNKIIPLSKAEELASENLAPNIKETVTEASLKYVCVTEQQEEVHIYRPMWCFTLENYDSSFVSGELFPRKMLFVDAVSGATYYSDDKTYTFAGN